MPDTSAKTVYSGHLPEDAPAIAVIMAGGSGTRFWPLSRRDKPKQFLPLGAGEESLIQATASRVESLCGSKGVMVVTAENQRALVAEQLPEAAILSEPTARNTAACLAYAAAKVLETTGDVPMICLPADHIVSGVSEICKVYEKGCALAAEEEVLVTIGIRPTHPETGYGYIKTGDGLRSGAKEVDSFVEKPDQATAESYLSDGGYFWNSGMFIWRPSVLLAAIARHQPDLHNRIEKIAESFGTTSEFDQIHGIYGDIEPVSIDVGVMQEAENVVMFPGETFSWSDVGSWSSWSETKNEDADALGNVAPVNSFLLDTCGTTIVADAKFVAAIGLKDYIVVDTGDALLVCPKDRSQDVKRVVDELKKQELVKLL